MGAGFNIIELDNQDGPLLYLDELFAEFMDYHSEEILTLLSFANYFQDEFIQRSLELVYENEEIDVSISYYSKDEICSAFEEMKSTDKTESYDDIFTGINECLNNSMTFQHAIEDYLDKAPAYNFEQVYIRDLIDLINKNHFFVHVSSGNRRYENKEVYLNSPIQNVW